MAFIQDYDNSTMNVAPLPNSLSHQTLPCIASAIFFTMDKPRPVECSPAVGLALRRANFPNSFFWSSAVNPAPSSWTSQRAVPGALINHTYIFLPAVEYLAAFETSFSNTWTTTFG